MERAGSWAAIPSPGRGRDGSAPVTSTVDGEGGQLGSHLVSGQGSRCGRGTPTRRQEPIMSREIFGHKVEKGFKWLGSLIGLYV
jgi:hypothetical protein